MTRRHLIAAAFATPVLLAADRSSDSKVEGVQLGVQSYSFRDLPIRQAIAAMAKDGLFDCELFSPHIELEPAIAPENRPHRKDERKAEEDRLRSWRLTVPLTYFSGVRRQFDQAGINLYAYNLTLGSESSDKEIDRSFAMAKALGVTYITTSTTVPMAERMAPFADHHQMMVAFHGHSDVKDPAQFATPDRFEKALAMSTYYRINLDIGHFTAAGFDAVDYINQKHDKIILLHLKDRKKKDGPNTRWGEGDTPIKQVLALLKEKQYAIPAFIEYEYEGSGSSTAEVAECYSYAKRALDAAS